MECVILKLPVNIFLRAQYYIVEKHSSYFRYIYTFFSICKSCVQKCIYRSVCKYTHFILILILLEAKKKKKLAVYNVRQEEPWLDSRHVYLFDDVDGLATERDRRCGDCDQDLGQLGLI